jgi:hypothetical protein
MYRSISRLTLAAFAAAAFLAAAGCGSATADSLDQEQIAVPTGHHASPVVCEEVVATAKKPDWLIEEVVSVAERPDSTPGEKRVKSPWLYETDVALGHPLSPATLN